MQLVRHLLVAALLPQTASLALNLPPERHLSHLLGASPAFDPEQHLGPLLSVSPALGVDFEHSVLSVIPDLVVGYERSLLSASPASKLAPEQILRQLLLD